MDRSGDGSLGAGTLGLDLANNTGIIDALSNAPSTATFTGELYDVDNDPPTVTSITRKDPNPTAASILEFTVLFSEDMTGVTDTNFALTGTLAGTGTIASAVAVGTGQSWTVQVTGVSGDGTLGLDLANNTGIIDALSNALTTVTFTGELYDVDNSGATVTSITRKDPNPTAASILEFTVLFSEDVTGVTDTNFALTGTLAGTGTIHRQSQLEPVSHGRSR